MTKRDEQKRRRRLTNLAVCKTLARQSRRVDVSSLCGPYSLLDAPSASHLDRIAAGDRCFCREAALPQLSHSTSHSRTPPPRKQRRKSPIYTPAAAKAIYTPAAKAIHTPPSSKATMGKNQHSKDRMFITATEHAGLYGGYKKKTTIGLTGALPFDCCALSLLPFDSPVCARDGILFDALQLLPYVQEKGVSPATGKKLTVKDVLRLKMAKNQDNQWHCPVTCKVFTNHSKVVCIATTGHVFSKDAVKELCFKRNCLGGPVGRDALPEGGRD